MARKLTFALQKGGVGKTTSTVVTAEILGNIGYRVLVADFDPQGNATKMLANRSIYDFSGRTIMEAIQTGSVYGFIENLSENVSLIPAEDRLATFSRYIYTNRIDRPYSVLSRILSNVDAEFDFILIDVGPSLGDEMMNAISCVDDVIIPVDLGDLAMEAMTRFISFIDSARDRGYSHAAVAGILLTMRDARSRYEREISEGIRAVYGDLVFETEIRRRTKIKEISANGVDLSDRTMIDYVEFVAEYLKRLEDGNHDREKHERGGTTKGTAHDPTD